MKVMFVQKQIGDDIFFVRKVKKHWWSRYKTCPSDGRYDFISGVFYKRDHANTILKHR